MSRFRTEASSYILAVILLLAFAALFFTPGRRGAADGPGPARNVRAGYYSYRSRLASSASTLSGFKNKIEKRLESRGLPAQSFGTKDTDALLRTCASLEALLLEVGADPGWRRYTPQIAAARTAARELVFETAKLHSLIKGHGPDSAKVLGQLSSVEGSADRLGTHIEGLIRLFIPEDGPSKRG